MPDFLGRALTTPELIVKAAIEKAFHSREKMHDIDKALGRLASSAPGSFFTAALSLLGSTADPAERRRIYNGVSGCSEFWVELLQADRFNRLQLRDIGRFLMTVEELVDVRLARLLPGRTMADSKLSPEAVLRALDLLDQLSPGSRLILLLNHLTHHVNRRIAAKATLLVGRRLRNQNWVAQRLDSDDGRVRASAVEGMWGVQSPGAHASLWASLKDKNNRVVGNALIGLHQLGEPRVNEFIKRMIEDQRPPFRWTAAWVMGKIGAEEFVEYLDRAINDKEPQVRRAAERARDAIVHRESEPKAQPEHAVAEP